MDSESRTEQSLVKPTHVNNISSVAYILVCCSSVDGLLYINKLKILKKIKILKKYQK